MITFIAWWPVLVCRGKWHSGMSVRLGKIPDEYSRALSGKKNVWIHAVSVGEVLVILDLVRRIKDEFPNHQIVCSTVTPAGYTLARERLGSGAVVIFAPLDFSWVVRAFVNLIKPRIYIAAETEIWPNIYWLLKERNVPIIQVNGRISDKSCRGYRMIRWLTKDVLRSVEIFCVQTQLDAQRMIDLGAESHKISIVGNLKFDHPPKKAEFSRVLLGYEPEHQVLLAGSTHPGEEELLLDIFRKTQEEFPSLRLIIAPRHIERVEEVLKIIRSQGFSTIKFSQIEGHKVKDQVLVIDSIGQLASLYELADIVFVGKSLVDGGGQNIMEPAWFAKPIIIGPYMNNFRDAVQLFLREGAIKQVQNEQQFGDALVLFLKRPEDRVKMGKLAQGICEQNIGATEKTFKEIVRLMGSSRS